MAYRMTLREAFRPPFWAWGGAAMGAGLTALVLGPTYFVPALLAFAIWYGALCVGGLLNHFGWL